MPVRETYWNIPHWTVTLLYITQALGMAVLIGRLFLRTQLWYKGQGKLSFDRFWARVWRVFKYAFAQTRIARESYRGIMHLSIFLAFVVLFIGTVLATIDQDIAVLLFDVKLLKGDFYLIYEFVLDLFTVAGIIGMFMAFMRRVVTRPKRLVYNPGFGAMLWLLLILLLTGLVLESLRLATVQPDWQTWSFAGYAVSRIWVALDFNEQLLRTLHHGMWTFHFLLTGLLWVVFLDLPLRHIIYAPLNVFFSSFKKPGELAPLDLEDETVETFGVSQLTDLSIFQLMDADACTECGLCQAACPAYMAGTPLSPRQIVLDIRAGLTHYAPSLQAMEARKTLPDTPLLRNFVDPEAIWACTTCRACVYECPVLIEHIDSIVDMRRSLVLMDGDVPDLLATAMTQAERAGNPWGNPRGTRMQWAEGLSVPLISEKQQVDVLYWVGCAGAYDPESQKTARAMVSIFESANINYAVLGDEERCNCEWARRAGNEYLFQEATHSNIAVFDQYEFKVIVTHCPHCFNTFANEYPQFGGNYDVMHHSTYIAQLIADGHLKVDKSAAETITFHDSCYLGRYNDIYEAPRDVLSASGNINLVEMDRSRGKGLCCGGGGAQVWFETHQEIPVNEIRLVEAMETGASTVASSCPFCSIMLSSAAQSKGVTDQVQLKDIALVVAESLTERVK